MSTVFSSGGTQEGKKMKRRGKASSRKQAHKARTVIIDRVATSGMMRDRIAGNKTDIPNNGLAPTY